METTLYSREFLHLKDLYLRGELGRLQFLRASHHQDMTGWPAYWEGMPPMHNATHDDANFGQLVYCALEQGCGCPPGSVNTAPIPEPLDGRSLAFGITGWTQNRSTSNVSLVLKARTP